MASRHNGFTTCAKVSSNKMACKIAENQQLENLRKELRKEHTRVKKMVCRIADNHQLEQLQKELGIAPQCHSLRTDCIRALARPQGNYVMGGPGAAMGYCQGLFNKEGTPEEHTRKVREYLKSINAPHPESHELIYRGEKNVADYIEKAIAPLRGTGRVPILITDLDPAKDMGSIEEILATKPAVHAGESILVRLGLNSNDSIGPTVKIINSLLDKSRSECKMPTWWPLLQAPANSIDWNELKSKLGDAWKYTNIAVTPFSDESVYQHAKQITVAQFLVGKSEGITPEGNVTMPYEMCVGSSLGNKTYNIFDYAAQLKAHNLRPISIICGPSQGWTLEQNLERVQKYIPLFKEATRTLWKLNDKAREKVLSLPA